MQGFPILLLLIMGLMTTACGETTLPKDLISASPTNSIIFYTPIPSPEYKATRRSTATPRPTATLRPTSTYSPNSIGPDNYPNLVNPLTGLTVDNARKLNKRPVSVKITLYPRSARPQWGLSQADIVYEYYHNNDLTRFNAIFHTNDVPMVGPIRSARLFDNYLISMYKADFVFGSADSRILDFLKSQDYADRLIYYLSGTCPPSPTCRYDPAGSNYLITDTAAARAHLKNQGVKDKRQNLNGMSFSPLVPEGGQSISKISIRYSYSAYLYWQYDKSSGRYFRYQDIQEAFNENGEAHQRLVDRINGEPIQADNVVVLTISHCHAIYVPPEGGVPAIEIVDMDFVQTGIAYAFRDGKAYQTHWVRLDNDWVVYLINQDGSPYFFKPGTTWFQVITDKSSLSTSKDRIRFEFKLQIPPRMCPFNLR